MKYKTRVNLKSVTKLLIILFMLFGVRITHMVFPFSDNPLVSSVILILIIFICFALESFQVKTCCKKTRILLGILMIGVIISTIISTAIPKAAILYGLNYASILLCVPLLHMLKRGRWDIESLIKTIVWVTVIAYLIRFIITYVQFFSGKMILQGMYAETIAKGDWFRNGYMRLNPPCFGNIFVPLVFYLLINEKKKSKIVIYWMMIALALFYTYRVHASRSVLIYQTFELVFLIMVYKKSQIKKILLMVALFVVFFIIVESGYLNRLFDLFSLSNMEYGYSTYSRLLSLAHFGGMYLKHPITGVGFIPAENMGFMNLNYSSKYILEGGNLSDIGFLYSIVQIGLPVVVFYILFFQMGYEAGKLHRKNRNNHNYDILAWGIIIAIAITGVNIDLFFSVYLYSAPFCLAIIDWIYYNAKKERHRLC